MNKRTYISVEPNYSMTKKRGVIVGHTIKGENTSVHITDRFQNENQVILGITFEDFDYSMTMKCNKDFPDEGKYAEYVACLMEEDSLEEIYKTAQLIAIIHLQRTIDCYERLHKEYLAGNWCYPMNKSNVDGIMKDVKYWKKIISTIDVKESDLKYFESFLVNN